MYSEHFDDLVFSILLSGNECFKSRASCYSCNSCLSGNWLLLFRPWSDLQLSVVGQGLEELGPVWRSKVEGERRPQLRRNLEDCHRMHLETRQNIQRSRQTAPIVPFLPQGPLKKNLQTALSIRTELWFAPCSSSFQISDLQTIFSDSFVSVYLNSSSFFLLAKPERPP